MNERKAPYLFKGGLAEVVTNPSRITFSFLTHWFSGTGSLGMAWNLLHVPHESLPISVLVKKGKELYVDLCTEETLLYSKTIFSYKPVEPHSMIPVLTVSPKKLFHPISLLQTTKLVWQQAQWISHQQDMIVTAKKFLDTIPIISTEKLSRESIDETITQRVLPYSLAIDYLYQFFHALLLNKTTKKEYMTAYIDQEAKESDWIFTSIRDQYKVKNGLLSFEEYMTEYGMRADEDYELTSPRWHEIQPELQRRMNEALPPPYREKILMPGNDLALTNHVIQLSKFRSDARKKILPWINALRYALLDGINNSRSLDSLTRQDFHLSGDVPLQEIQEPQSAQIPNINNTGLGVSPGIAKGKIQIVTHSSDQITPDTIVVFPNASPTYALLYSKCKGIIFLSGGRTSHGVIVSREYGIPAVIIPNGNFLQDKEIEINGSTGTWTLT